MSEQTFAEQVETLVGKATDVDGIKKLSEDVIQDIPPEVLDAAQRELRYRNTQSNYTKSRKESKKFQEISKQLTDQLISNATIHISAEQQEELDELKLKDPDKWREKLTTYEQEAKAILQSKVDEAHKAGNQVSELELRQMQLDAFVESTGIQLNDEIIQNDLPASYTRQLEDGTITFDEFLSKAQKYLTATKIVQHSGKTDEELEGEDLKQFKKLSGTKEPNKEAVQGDLVETYRSEIY